MWASTTLHPVKTREDTSKISFGLYRDDGLALLRNLNGQETDKVKKNIIRVFKDIDFSLEIETNLKDVDFLDVSLNCKMELIVPRKTQTIGFFTFIVYQTTHQTSKSKFWIPSNRDCQKTRLMSRYSTQQNVNTKMLWRKVGSKLILNTTKINSKNQKINLEILFGLTHHSTK